MSRAWTEALSEGGGGVWRGQLWELAGFRNVPAHVDTRARAWRERPLEKERLVPMRVLKGNGRSEVIAARTAWGRGAECRVEVKSEVQSGQAQLELGGFVWGPCCCGTARREDKLCCAAAGGGSDERRQCAGVSKQRQGAVGMCGTGG